MGTYHFNSNCPARAVSVLQHHSMYILSPFVMAPENVTNTLNTMAAVNQYTENGVTVSWQTVTCRPDTKRQLLW